LSRSNEIPTGATKVEGRNAGNALAYADLQVFRETENRYFVQYH
jgi:hypothetical protein